MSFSTYPSSVFSFLSKFFSASQIKAKDKENTGHSITKTQGFPEVQDWGKYEEPTYLRTGKMIHF